MGVPEEYFKYTQELYLKYGKDKTIVLMHVGDFFEVYGMKNRKTGEISGSNIEAFKNELGMKMSDKKGEYKGQSLLMAGFPLDKRDYWCSRLHNAGYIIAIYEQVELLPDKSYRRALTEIISPGTYFYSTSESISNHCTCVWINKQWSSRNKMDILYFGMATIDVYSGKSYIFQYNTEYRKNSSPYDELERFIVSHQPNQVIFIHNLECQDIDNIIKYVSVGQANIQKYNINDVNSTNIRLHQIENCRKQTYQKEVLKKFFKSDLMNEYDKYAYATETYCFLLEYSHEHNPSIVDKIVEPVFQNVSDRVILANHSLKQLNIISNNDLIETTKNISSIEKFLNKCQTPMGKRLLHYEILNPISDVNTLRDKYSIVDSIITVNTQENEIETIRKQLSYIIDIEKLNRKIIKLDATPSDICNLQDSIDKILHIYKSYMSFLDKISYGKSIIPEIKKKNIKKRCREYMHDIGHFLDKDKASLINTLNYDDNFIKKGVDENHDKLLFEYYDIIGKLDVIINHLNMTLETVAKRSNGKVMIEIESKKDETNIIITAARFKKLKEAISSTQSKLEYENLYDNSKQFYIFSPDLNSVPAKKGSVYIRTPEIETMCDRLHDLKKEISTSLCILYQKFIIDLKERHKYLEMISDFIADLDLNYTKAFLALKYNYCMPIIDDGKSKSFVEAKQLRHPLIENLNNDETYIANDIELNSTQQGILLFGTNAVGKSSLIKAIGISVIMAQAGFFVPASNFMYNPYRSIYTRILGNDNLFKGLSTFAVEMTELTTILNGANENSLIIGDEVCSGTEVESATSIITASLEGLYHQNSSFIFATHYHEICEYDEIKELSKMAIKHLSVSLNPLTNVLEYNRILKDGQGDTFYGLTVAEAYKLPTGILDRSHEIRNKYLNRRGIKQDNILNLKQSRYNSKQLQGKLCEKCKKKISTDIHHLQHQANADKNDFIGHLHKNSLGNLIAVCQECHDEFHKQSKQNIKIKTTNGNVLVDIN